MVWAALAKYISELTLFWTLSLQFDIYGISSDGTLTLKYNVEKPHSFIDQFYSFTNYM